MLNPFKARRLTTPERATYIQLLADAELANAALTGALLQLIQAAQDPELQTYPGQETRLSVPMRLAIQRAQDAMDAHSQRRAAEEAQEQREALRELRVAVLCADIPSDDWETRHPGLRRAVLRASAALGLAAKVG